MISVWFFLGPFPSGCELISSGRAARFGDFRDMVEKSLGCGRRRFQDLTQRNSRSIWMTTIIVWLYYIMLYMDCLPMKIRRIQTMITIKHHQKHHQTSFLDSDSRLIRTVKGKVTGVGWVLVPFCPKPIGQNHLEGLSENRIPMDTPKSDGCSSLSLFLKVLYGSIWW